MNEDNAPRILTPERTPVRHQKAAEFIADELRRKIVREGQVGDYLSGERVLIESFGVSRPTLREAMRILESEGLVEIRRGLLGGAVIRHPSIEELALRVGTFLQVKRVTYEDLFLVREIIEPAAARLAAERVAQGGRGEYLDELVHREAEAIGSLEGDAVVSESLTGFHEGILELSGSTTLAVLGKLLHVTIDSHNRSSISALRGRKARLEALQESHRAHQALARAVRKGDADRAEKMMRSHLEGARVATGLSSRDRYIDVFGGVIPPAVSAPGRARSGLEAADEAPDIQKQSVRPTIRPPSVARRKRTSPRDATER